ncbi:hypothetical protein [Rhodobium gokarnense]|uniref:Uncharacterized protein n=1 Tax=Rhodobium gokarnense TaxID=364296 RepID=A0ABT3HH61_9HYPH|nr:hypothetical protein [Rhodobium gokarnense]MCW2309742.1 hypothetical protein [Rhodobium gokarnense]
MKIDGYVPVDQKIAGEDGVTFEYDLGFGMIRIRSKSLSGHDNPQFRIAMKAYSERQERRKKLGSEADKDLARQLAGIVYDTGVLSWSTTIKSDGAVIAATRENFIDLMTDRACERAFDVFIGDATDEQNFRAVPREEDAKNSAAPSDGKSSGASTQSDLSA